MTRGITRTVGLWIASLLIAAAPASAQVVHSLHIAGGGFFPKGLETRIGDDVLLRNYVGEPAAADPTRTDALDFDPKGFRSGFLIGEWNVAFGNHIEIGAGVGFSRKSVPSIYLDFEDRITHADLRQMLRLQVVPVTGVVRFLPFGDATRVQPYIGAGVSALRFRYIEEGEFVDTESPILEIFEDRFVARGTALGGVVVGGVRFPVRGDIYGITLELRRQFGAGETGGLDNGFLADKIDLGGTQFTAGMIVRF